MRLTDFKALTFDCYGTLIDWETGMVEALKPLASQAKTPLSRNTILEAHARHESAQQLQTPENSIASCLRSFTSASRRVGAGRDMGRLPTLRPEHTERPFFPTAQGPCSI